MAGVPDRKRQIPASQEARRRFQAAPVAGFIQKPYTAAQLAASIRAALAEAAAAE